MKIRSLLAMVLTLLVGVGTALADRSPILKVRTQNRSENGSVVYTGYGSGSAVGYVKSDLVIVTAGHVVSGKSPVIAVDMDGKWTSAKILDRHYDPSNCGTDYAILVISDAENWPCYEIAESSELSAVNKGQMWGFPGGESIRGGVFNSLEMKSGTLWWKNGPIEGMSGGPVLIEVKGKSKVGAVISSRTTEGAGYREGLGTGCSYVRRKLIERFGCIPEVPKSPDKAKDASPGVPRPPPVRPDDEASRKYLADLAARIKAIEDQPIIVELRSPSGVIKRHSFKPGEPIRLQLPERPSDAPK